MESTWWRVLCACVCACSAASGGALHAGRALARLHGERGRNGVLVCLRAQRGGLVRACPGALLHEQWAGVPAVCLRTHPRHLTSVERGAARCGGPGGEARGEGARLYHAWWDLAALRLHRPYARLDRHPNSTAWTAARVLHKHGVWKWLKNHIKSYGITRDTEYQYKRIAAVMISTQAPVFTFVFSVLTPLLLLLLVSLYVIHYTGSFIELPYKIWEYSMKPVQL